MKPSLPPKKNLSLPKAFTCALAGLKTAYLRERNFRLQLGIALVAVYGGVCFSLAPAEWAALLLTVAFALTCELFNSALEHLTDYYCDGERNSLAGAVKDIAAGASLLASIAAVGVGIALFWRPTQFPGLIEDILSRPLLPSLVLLAAFLIARLPDTIRASKEADLARRRNQFPPKS